HFVVRQLLQRLLFAGLNADETHRWLRSPQSARAQRHLFTLPKYGPAVYALSAKVRTTTRAHDGLQVL
ncbi:MAG: hypothetical protein WBF62_05245, partial [Bradyrhizobium sp.]